MKGNSFRYKAGSAIWRDNFNFSSLPKGDLASILGKIVNISGETDRFSSNKSKESNLYRILIVDDEKDITTLFKVNLEQSGFIVTTFNEPFEALTQYRPDSFDIVLLDVRMPRLSGVELYRELKRKDPSLKACLMTAFEVIEEELKKFLPDGDNPRIIVKPISIKDLVRIIREEISGRV